MAIDKAFVISTPSNKASTWSELFGGDDISAVDKPISDYSALDALRYYATDREVVRDPSGINTKPVEGIPGSSYILGTSIAKLNNVTDETRNTNQTKEEKMTNVLNIEVGATLINNVPSSKFTEDQIIDMIKAENAKIEALKSVTTQSVNINGKIEVCQFNIELLIDILDEDEEIVE